MHMLRKTIKTPHEHEQKGGRGMQIQKSGKKGERYTYTTQFYTIFHNFTIHGFTLQSNPWGSRSFSTFLYLFTRIDNQTNLLIPPLAPANSLLI